MNNEKPKYEQIKENDWLIKSVLNEFEKIKTSTGHGKIIITIQKHEVFEIESSEKTRNPNYKK